MANPNPVRTPEFEAHIIRPRGQQAMKLLGVKIPAELDAAIRKRPDRADWVREALLVAALEDGLISKEQARELMSTIGAA